MSTEKFNSPKEHCLSFVRKRESQLCFSSCSWFTARHSKLSRGSLSLSFFSLLFSLSQPLCLFVFLSLYVPIPVCITCVYTYVTPRIWYVSIYPSCLNTYTSPRTTLFSSKSFLPLKVFNILPVYFHCISLTTENPVINLSGQKSVILEDRVIGFAHIFIWLCSICVRACKLYVPFILFFNEG